MSKMPVILPVTDLRQAAAKALQQIQSSGEPVVITQRGRGAAVLMSLEAYERGERERELLRLLARGEREIAAGKGFELETVLADAGDLLARKPR